MATITHATDDDSVRARLTRAICGRLVQNDEREINLTEPTCPRCAAILAEREAEDLPAWALDGVAKVPR